MINGYHPKRPSGHSTSSLAHESLRSRLANLHLWRSPTEPQSTFKTSSNLLWHPPLTSGHPHHPLHPSGPPKQQSVEVLQASHFVRLQQLSIHQHLGPSVQRDSPAAAGQGIGWKFAPGQNERRKQKEHKGRRPPIDFLYLLPLHLM